MHRLMKTAALALICASVIPVTASAYEGNWKRGRVYYKGVCTECHKEQKSSAIAPNSYTIAEWKAYLQADKHAGGKDTVTQYISAAYRGSVKDSNKVAKKFADNPSEELLEDIKAFVTKGAKDGDAPASCN